MQLLILGANSHIAQAVARVFAEKEKVGLYLASRDMETLEKFATDLACRYQVTARAIYFDATAFESHQDFYASLIPKPDGVVLAFGYLGDQKTAQADFSECSKIFNSNFAGAVSMLEIIAADFEERRKGLIIGISSVAGERGRQSNYIYGSVKGALTLYLGGLRNRLYKNKVSVITVLPGFVRTKMTRALDLPEKLTADPQQVAEDIYTAFQKGKDIVYTKGVWRYIMLIIRMIPETVFKHLSL